MLHVTDEPNPGDNGHLVISSPEAGSVKVEFKVATFKYPAFNIKYQLYWGEKDPNNSMFPLIKKKAYFWT